MPKTISPNGRLHTDPEILRSSLAGVILRMGSLKLGEVEDFPFLDRPLPRMVADGYQLLNELGAVDDDRATDAARPRTGEAADSTRGSAA